MSVRQPGDVPAGACKVVHESPAHRIRIHGEDDREGARRLPSSVAERPQTVHHEDIEFELHQLRCQSGEPLGAPCCVALLDGDVPALYVAQLPKSLPEGRDQLRSPSSRCSERYPILTTFSTGCASAPSVPASKVSTRAGTMRCISCLMCSRPRDREPR